MEPITIIALGVVALAVIAFLLMWAVYRVVPPSEAHVVVTPKGRFVAAADGALSTTKDEAKMILDGGTTYYAIPPIPGIGRKVRKMDVANQEHVNTMETYEKGQARYGVRFSIKYRISNVLVASEKYINTVEMKKHMDEIVKAAVRAVTVKYNVIDARAKKQEMSDEIEKQIAVDLAQYGLQLVNFVLVDFEDTEDSTIISDISKRKEVEVNSETRQLVAEKEKAAKEKEARARESYRQAEIKADETIAKREQDKVKNVAIQEKLAKEKELEVTKVTEVKTAEIAKAKELVVKATKKLEGEGDRDKAVEVAVGNAAPTKQEGLAEAAALTAKQVALSKFDERAIIALTAEKIVEKDKTVGVKTAEAMSKADIKMFAGGQSGEAGMDFAQVLEAMKTGSSETSTSILNRLSKPNDLGINLGGMSTEDLMKKLAEIQSANPKTKPSKA